MMVKITLEAMVTLPEGTIVPEQGRAFTLPNGDTVKPWIIMELNDDKDLTYGEAATRDIYCDEGTITVEAAGWVE
jgi:hypothetical protein